MIVFIIYLSLYVILFYYSIIVISKILKSIKCDRKRVIMTGFEPFNGMDRNPSGEGVNKLHRTTVENKYGIILTKKISVRYASVDQIIPNLLEQVRPHLSIHVGVADNVTCFVLETQARKTGYYMHDEDDLLHVGNTSDGPSAIATQLDVAAICRSFNRNSKDDLRTMVSTDAGLYLCEYIYYTSLSHGRNPSLLVHVPSIKYSTEQLAQGLERILELCLKQLRA